MDSRIREALEKAVDIYSRYRGNCQKLREHLYHDWYESAAALLNAEPEPCKDIGAVLEALYQIEKEIDFCDGGNPFIFHKRQIEAQHKKAEVIDAYASRREQEARADERRRFEPVMGKLDEALGAEDWHEVKSAWCDLDAIINPDQSAILQGTEPAKVSEDVNDALDMLALSISQIDDKVDRGVVSQDYDRLVARLKEGLK